MSKTDKVKLRSGDVIKVDWDDSGWINIMFLLKERDDGMWWDVLSDGKVMQLRVGFLKIFAKGVKNDSEKAHIQNR